MAIVDRKIGNLLTSGEKRIAHGVNCLGVMGGGIALQIKERWPNTFLQYKQYCKLNNWSDTMLGEILITGEEDLIIYNMFTQFDVSRNKDRNASYDAIADAFSKLEALEKPSLAIPLIGAGLGGGNWHIIAKIINESAPNTPIIVYELE